MRKMVFIVAWLKSDPEAYEGVSDANVEKGHAEKVEGLPYVAKVEKVTVMDFEG